MKGQRLKRLICTHVITVDEHGGPVYDLRSCRATPENERAFFGAVLSRYTCRACGDERLSLKLGEGRL